MSSAIRFIVCSFVLASIGCYHATIDTGLTPSTVTIEEPWAAAWIYGLVPPNTISTEAKCKDGVAKVETQHSFLNQLVGFITFGIFTPMEIKVTCAAGNSSWIDGHVPDIVLGQDATQEEITKAFMQAADIAVQEGRPVLVAY